MSQIRIKPTFVSSAKLDNVPIINGRHIICIDNGLQFIDFNNKRILITSIITLEEDTDRTSVSSPINGKFYFINKTHSLWFYNDGWFLLNQLYSHPLSSVVPDTYNTVTVDEYGHIISGSHEPVSITNGGTGSTTVAGILETLNIEDHESRITALEANLLNIMNQLNGNIISYSPDEDEYTISHEEGAEV